MPLYFPVALLTSLFFVVSGAKVGFSFGTEQWSHPSITFAGAASRASLKAMQSTGVGGIRLLVTAYVDAVDSTTVHGISNTSSSPYATASLEDVDSFISYASSLNLTILLQPYLDLNWDIPSNAHVHAWYAANSTGRNNIGSGLTNDAEWDAFFVSYGDFLLPLAAIAQARGVAYFSLGDELDVVWSTQAVRLRSLIARVRLAYKGAITASSNGRTLGTIAWWDAVDFIGHNAFWPLGSDYAPVGQPPSVASLADAWTPIISILANISSTNGGKRILITAAGTQSKINCHIRPWGSGSPTVSDGNDQGDVSAWAVAYDMTCQANVYAATLQALPPQDWLEGLYFWRWNADDTAGGASALDRIRMKTETLTFQATALI